MTPRKRFKYLERNFLTLFSTGLYLKFDLLSLPTKEKFPCHLPPWRCLFVTIFGIFMLKTKQCSWQALKITAIQIWIKKSVAYRRRSRMSRCQRYLGRSDKKMHYFPWKWRISCISLKKQTILGILLHVKLASSNSCPWSTGV